MVLSGWTAAPCSPSAMKSSTLGCLITAGETAQLVVEGDRGAPRPPAGRAWISGGAACGRNECEANEKKNEKKEAEET